MPVFPGDNSIYSDGDRSILNRMEQDYQNYVTPNQTVWGQADLDLRFYSGDQTVFNEYYGTAVPFGRRQFCFNLIRRIVETTAGYQRQNRKTTIITPRENSDQYTADLFSKLILWSDSMDNTDHIISEAFTGALITGMNLIQVYMDWKSDPVCGDIRTSNCSYNTFLIDPFFKNPDLSDCNSIWKRSFLNKEQIIGLLPDKKEIILGMFGQGNKDGKFRYMPESFNWDQQNLLTYDEYYYRTARERKMVINSQTGRQIEFKGDEDALRQFLSDYPELTLFEDTIPTVNLAVVVNGMVMYNGGNPLGIDKYPFVPVMGYYEPNLPYFEWRVQGMVRGLRDPQFIYNHRKRIELDILESQLNSGWVAEEDSVVDPQSLYKTGQGSVVWTKEGKQLGVNLHKIPPGAVDGSMFQISQDMERLVQQIAGGNDELYASATDDKAAILAKQRQGAGLLSLQRFFDQLDLSQTLLGRIKLEVMQNNFTPDKVERVTEQPPSEEFYNKLFGKYDAVVEEGFNTSTQRQMAFAQALYLKEAGVPIPSNYLVKMATLQDKQELIKSLEEQEQAQAQQAQQQAQVAMAEQQAAMQLAQARAFSDQAMGQERLSRIQENTQLAVERRAEAEKDKTAALLNFMKVVKELEQIDLDNLSKVMQLMNSVKTPMAVQPPDMGGM